MHPSTSQHNYLRACLLMHSQTLRLNRQQTHLDGLAHSLQSNSAAPYCMHKNCSCSAFAHALPQAKCQQQEGHRRRTHSFLEVWRVLHVLHVYSHYVTHHHPDPQASAHSCRSGLLSKKFSVRFSVRLTKNTQSPSPENGADRGPPAGPEPRRTSTRTGLSPARPASPDLRARPLLLRREEGGLCWSGRGRSSACACHPRDIRATRQASARHSQAEAQDRVPYLLASHFVAHFVALQTGIHVSVAH